MNGRHAFKVCAINGSSRGSNGQTARRLGGIVAGLRALGVRAETVHLAKTPLAPCDGSEVPKRRADITALLKKLEAADGIIFGTPTYWFNMSALMKNLIDRLTVTEKGWTLEGKVAGFVATGAPQEDGAMMALSTLGAAVNHLGMLTFPYSMIYFRGRSGPDWAEKDIEKYPARMLKMLECVRHHESKW